jgi:hypothetical protein
MVTAVSAILDFSDPAYSQERIYFILPALEILNSANENI